MTTLHVLPYWRYLTILKTLCRLHLLMQLYQLRLHQLNILNYIFMLLNKLLGS